MSCFCADRSLEYRASADSRPPSWRWPAGSTAGSANERSVQGCGSSSQETCENALIARFDRLPRPVAACLHHGLAADQHRLHGGAPGDEDPGVEPLIAVPRGEIGMLGV